MERIRRLPSFKRAAGNAACQLTAAVGKILSATSHDAYYIKKSAAKTTAAKKEFVSQSFTRNPKPAEYGIIRGT